ncbi:MAG: DUF11 domain-containing protein [Microthrixaceae bacterium]|nr:DUF11 domain-containing protein [Microthrixaceae bacterium]
MAFESFDGCSGDAGMCAAVIDLGPRANTPGAGNSRIAWFFDDLAPAAADRKVTLSYTVVVGDAYADDSKVAAGDRLTNSVAAHWNADDQITTDPTEPPAPGGFDRNTPNSTDTVSVVEPKLNIDKDVGGQSGDSDARTADVDETLTYTVTATNATGSSVSAGHDLTITDVVPDGLDVDVDSITGGGGYDTDTRTITWSVPGPVAPGDSVGFTYQAAIGDSAGIAGDATLVNTATLSSYFGVAAAERGDHDGTPASEDERTYRTYGPVDDAVTVTPRFPELTLAKTSTGGATIDSPFTWTVTARNTSSVADAFDVDLVDTLPDHWTYETGSATISVDGTPGTVVANPSMNGPVLTWTDLGNLAPGKSLVLTYRATPGLDARDNDDQINSVTVTGDDADGNDRNADGPYTDVDTDEPALTGAALGDLVWEDLNGNGVQDGGEPGIKGVAVTLYASDGTTVLDTTTTGDDGEYRFDRLAAGSYVVGFATPATYTPTASLRGSDITKDSDAGAAGRTAVITLAAGQQDVRVDAGFYRLVDLGNFVWDDLNGDGVQDDGEPGLKGITVNLYVEGGTDPIRTGPTGDDGDYLFKDLPPGDYVVEFVVPDGSTVSPVGVGGDRDADSNPDRETGRAAVTLVSNVDDLTLDAGMFTGAAIGDVVFYDLDGDGIQDDNEPGAAGITVELLQNGQPVDGQPAVQTGASGAYSFGSLVPGDYSVRFTAPSGFVFSPTGAGTPATDSDAEPDGNNPSLGTTPATSLTSGETDNTWDAGLVGTGTLGDFVWDDLNGDGIQDGGEPGLKDVTVTLTWAGPDGKLGGDDSDDDVVIGSMPTGDDGAYLFENLPPGTYGVTLTDVPAGYLPTGDLDGVASPSTATATLGAGQNRLDVDFGYQLQADLALTKVVDEAARLSGEQATFRLDVLNNGPAPAVGPIRVVDQVPVGLSDIAAAGDGWACDVAGQTVTCTQAGPLAVDGSLPEIVVTATVDGDATSTLNNTATVDSATADHLLDNNTDNAEVDVTPAADLSLDKAHATDAFVVGSTGTYTLQVSNKGPSAAVGTEAKPITVTDTLPEGLVPTTAAGTDWTCDLDGQDVTCTIVGIFADDVALPVISLDVSVEVAAEGGVTNTGVVAPGDTVDPIGDNNTDEDPTDVLPAADLSITKSPNGPFTPGETDSYDLQVTNGGPSADPGPITVVDTYPTELAYSANLTTDDWECDDDADLREVTCTYRPSGPHPVGDLKPLTLEFDVAHDVAAEVEIVNAARVSSPTIDPNPDNDSSDGRTTTKPKADLVVDKRHAGDFRVGTPGSWLLTVGNNGPSTVAGVTTVTDTLPDGIGYIDAVGDGWLCAEADGTVTCASSAAVAPGASFPAITMTVTVGPAAYPEVTNTAKVDAPEGITDTDAGNNSDDDQVTVGPLADLAVTKTHEGDFTVGVDGTFTVDVTNLGSTEDPGPLTVVDTLPAGLTFASGGNEDWSCEATGPTVTCVRTDGLGVDESTSFPIRVDVGTEAEGGVTNTVTVSSPTPDPVEDNDGAIDEVVVVPSADLSLTKTHSGNFVVGRAGTWTLQLVNNGPSVSRGPITVSDTVPSGFEVTGAAGEGWNCTVEAQDVTCVLADDLALGDATPVTVDVVPQAGAEGTATNTATVAATTGDPDGDNNSSTDSVEVEAAVDLVLTKRLESDSLVEGASATYLLSLTNNGPSSASQVVLTDELPEGLEYREFTGEGWSCDGPGPIVTCALEGELAAGASTELRLVVRVSGAPGKSVENVASAESNGVESNSADNGDTSGVSGIEAVPPVDPGETPDPDNPAEDAERTATGGTDPSGSTAAADPSTIPDRLPQVDTPGTARLPTGLSNTGATLAPYLVLAFSMMLLGVGLRRGAKRRRG